MLLGVRRWPPGPEGAGLLRPVSVWPVHWNCDLTGLPGTVCGGGAPASTGVGGVGGSQVVVTSNTHTDTHVHAHTHTHTSDFLLVLGLDLPSLEA